MNSVQQHRGPDDEGLYADASCVLGHRRLSIIDLSRDGRQPFSSDDGRYQLVFNGEIYNYVALRNELKGLGWKFHTLTDTEVLLKAYQQYGTDCLARFNGMFALAVYDSEKETIFLARDRVGKKPLYYMCNHGRLYFASEIKALQVVPDIDLTISETALALYLKYAYIPAPYSIYRAIRKFPAACYAHYNRDARLTFIPYWHLPEQTKYDRSDVEWEESLASTLDDAVRLRLASDVPLGVFLSGGLDSSLIAAAAQRHLEQRAKTFCIGFDDPSYDESPHAETVARYLGTEHHTHPVAFDDVGALPELVQFFDEPFADASFLPTWYLCRATKEHVTVALSGDGGDELFGGYRRYLAGKLSGIYLSAPVSIRKRVIEPVVNKLPAPDGYYGRSVCKKAKLFISSVNRMETDRGAVSPRVFTDNDLCSLFEGLNLPLPDEDPLVSASCRYLHSDIVETMLRCDLITYLPDDILVKVDRMSMYHALEVRCPFLDYRVVELACQMPVSVKIRRLKPKFILRRVAKGMLPSRILKRNKQGFMVPLDLWFKAELKDFIYDTLCDSRAIWKKSQALKILDEHLKGKADYATQLWALAVLGLWLKQQPCSE